MKKMNKSHLLAVLLLCCVALQTRSLELDKQKTSKQKLDKLEERKNSRRQNGSSSANRIEINGATVSDVRTSTHEERLLKFLFEDQEYDPVARAVMDTSKTVTVAIDFVLLRMHGLHWIDDRLTWDPAEFGDLTSIIVTPESIWLPELAVMNGAEELVPDFEKIRVLLHWDGTLHWEPGGVFLTTCDIDVAYFPFDSQVCELVIGAYSYHSTHMNITNASSAISTLDFRINGEWHVASSSASWGITVLQMPGDSTTNDDQRPNATEGESNLFTLYGETDEMANQTERFSPASSAPKAVNGYSHVVFTLHFKRRYKFYMMNVILPCIMLSLLTMTVLCLAPESGEKIGLGISVLLAFTVFQLMVTESIPRTSLDIPLIVLYLMASMILGTLSVCMAVLVLNAHHRGITCRHVPAWIRLYILIYLARIIGYETALLAAAKTLSSSLKKERRQSDQSDPDRANPQNTCWQSVFGFFRKPVFSKLFSPSADSNDEPLQSRRHRSYISDDEPDQDRAHVQRTCWQSVLCFFRGSIFSKLTSPSTESIENTRRYRGGTSSGEQRYPYSCILDQDENGNEGYRSRKKVVTGCDINQVTCVVTNESIPKQFKPKLTMSNKGPNHNAMILPCSNSSTGVNALTSNRTLDGFQSMKLDNHMQEPRLASHDIVHYRNLWKKAAVTALTMKRSQEASGSVTEFEEHGSGALTANQNCTGNKSMNPDTNQKRPLFHRCHDSAFYRNLWKKAAKDALALKRSQWASGSGTEFKGRGVETSETSHCTEKKVEINVLSSEKSTERTDSVTELKRNGDSDGSGGGAGNRDKNEISSLWKAVGMAALASKRSSASTAHANPGVGKHDPWKTAALAALSMKRSGGALYVDEDDPDQTTDGNNAEGDVFETGDFTRRKKPRLIATLEDGDDKDGVEEWHEVARVLDRAFFWIMFGMMVISGGYILLHPMYRDFDESWG